MSALTKPVVLVVEDNLDVAETYEMWLQNHYEIRHAGDGIKALELLSDDVDVVLLDRMMPRMSGDQVLAELRERDFSCRVAMVTAVDPDFDIIEMGFDQYVRKPPTKELLLEIIDELVSRGEHTSKVRTYQSLLAKRESLIQEKSRGELATSSEFAQLEADIEALKTELDAQAETFLDDMSFIAAIRDFDEGTGGSHE